VNRSRWHERGGIAGEPVQGVRGGAAIPAASRARSTLAGHGRVEWRDQRRQGGVMHGGWPRGLWFHFSPRPAPALRPAGWTVGVFRIVFAVIDGGSPPGRCTGPAKPNRAGTGEGALLQWLATNIRQAGRAWRAMPLIGPPWRSALNFEADRAPAPQRSDRTIIVPGARSMRGLHAGFLLHFPFLTAPPQPWHQRPRSDTTP